MDMPITTICPEDIFLIRRCSLFPASRCRGRAPSRRCLRAIRGRPSRRTACRFHPGGRKVCRCRPCRRKPFASPAPFIAASIIPKLRPPVKTIHPFFAISLPSSKAISLSSGVAFSPGPIIPTIGLNDMVFLHQLLMLK